MAATSGDSRFLTSSGSTRAVGARRHRYRRDSRAAPPSPDWCRAPNSGTSTIERFSPRAASAALIAIMPQSSPCAPALGVMAMAGMPVSSRSQRDSSAISAMRARHGGERLQRMDVAEARQPRHALVEARVVLHGAGAEREQPGVDAVVLLAEPHVVPHRLGLAEARQPERRASAPACRAARRTCRLRRRSTPVVSVRPISKISAFLDGERRGCR